MKHNKIIQEYWFEKIDQFETIHSKSAKCEDQPSGKYVSKISKSGIDSVVSLASQNLIAEYTIFLSIFNALIKRYTNQEKVWVWSPIPQLESLEQNNNSQVFYGVEVRENDVFKKIIKNTKSEIEETLSFSTILYDTLKSRFLDNEITEEAYLQFGFYYNKVNSLSTDISKTKLCLGIEKLDNQNFDIVISYDQLQYSEVFVKNFANHFIKILENIQKELSTELVAVDILSDKEKKELIAFSGLYEKEDSKNVIDYFHDQVDTTPDHIAINYNGKSSTYKEIDEKANRLASSIQELFEIKSGDSVGIMTRYSEDTIVAMIATLKLGATYVPLDPLFPKSRLEYIISDTQPKTLLIHLDYLDTVLPFDIPSFAVDVMLDENQPYTTFQGLENDNDIAYIMYTSGSTGKPKGVVVQNKGIVRLVKNTNYIQVTEQDTILAISNPAFDGSTFDIWGALLNGATLCIPEKDLVLNFQQLSNTIASEQVTVAFMTTALFNSIVDNGLEEIGGLRKILFGGEKVSTDHVNRFVKRFGEGKLLHVYGPTENTTYSTFYPVNTLNESWNTVPIGKPISKTQCYILNSNLDLQPIEVEGELYVSGEGLAQGYLNQTELTEKSFISNPFNKNSRLYKTGDICRWLPDGNIEFVGRVDNQVKIRGFRIELGEIEKNLTQFTGIEKATVIVRNDANNVKFLSTFFVAENQIDQPVLVSFLKKEMPEYMIPAHITQVESFPLNRNGKIDQKKLVELEKTKAEESRKLVLPSTETEKILHQIWQELFETSDISIEDDFFEIGGHSIKATHLVAMIHKKMHVKIGISSVFEDRTIATLARKIESLQKNTFSDIQPISEQTDYMASPSQRRLWALSQLKEASLAYTIPGVYQFEGNLDRNALNSAFEKIVNRHESFRTVFRENSSGELRQVILNPEILNFEINEIQLEKSKCDDRQYIDQLVNKLSQVDFDLDNGPLLNVSLIQLQDAKWVLVCVMHHIISDGLSMEVFIDELLQFYKASAKGEDLNLPALRIQYKDYTAWQNEQLSGDSVQNHKDYWNQKFAGELPSSDFRKDKTRPKIKTYNGATISCEIANHTLKNFKNLLQEQEATLFMGLVSVINILFYKYTGREDVILGSQIAGRNHVDLEKQIGFYINVLPLRYQFSSNDSVIKLLQNVKSETLAAYEHQVYPFDTLIEDLKLKHDISRNPLFDVTVVLQNSDLNDQIDTLQDQDINVQVYEGANSAVSRFDISFNFVETSTGLTMDIVYNSDIYNSDTIFQIQTHVQQVVESVTQNPQTSIADCQYMSSEELTQVFQEFGAGTMCSMTKGVIDLFTEQVIANPDSEALVSNNVRLTYQELDIISDKVAYQLQSDYSVSRGDRVAVLLDKSDWLIATMLGILKLGAVYVPLEIETPQVRKKYILEDIAANVLVTQTEYMFDFDFFQGDIIAIDIQIPSRDSVESGLIKRVSNVHDVAYIMYTSGSTGRPKGVIVPQKGIVRLVKDADYLNFDQVHSILSTGAVSFDATTFEFWGALLNGGKLVLCDKNTILDVHKTTNLIEKEQVDTMWFTAGLFNQIVDQDLGVFENLKNVLVGGDKLSPKHVTDVLNKYSEINLINGYGPTENTTFSLTHKIELPLANDVPIGKPLNNSKAYILDKDLNFCPVGVVGEICVAGDGLATGYLNQDDLTLEKFIEPSVLNHERIYRTGDLGFWTVDGIVHFVGRKDNQVKVRGYRIELDDIEKTITSHPNVLNAVVKLVEEESQNDKLILAYVQFEEEEDKEELKNYMNERLPFYMLPSYFITVDHFDLNKNGKIDRNALTVPDLNQIRSEDEFETPNNETEETLVAIWKELLGLERISVTEDFFEIGGHSLRAIKLSNMIQEAFNIEVSINHIFQFRTIRAMATQIEFALNQEILRSMKGELQEIDLDF